MSRLPERTEELFCAAQSLPPEDQLPFVSREAAHDPQLFEAVASLLRHAAAERCNPIEPPGPDGGPAASGVPTRIGGYELLESVGKGGMGVVFRARQISTQQTVAIKFIRGLDYGSSDVLHRRFEVEGKALGRLDHPGIARVLDAGRAEHPTGPMPYLAMEFVPGESLADFVRRAQPSLRARVEIVAAIAEAVHHAHQRLVIHRDLKPGNIRINERGEPKVLDFGLARIMEPEFGETLSSARDVLGTLAYMSPEQASGTRAEVDVRTDVYALGVILYELLTGTLPYDLKDLSLMAAIRRICEQEIKPPQGARLNRDLACILGKALAKRKEERYGSAADLAADLRRHLRGEPVSVRSASRVYQITRFAARHRALMAGTVLALIAIPLLVVGVLHFRSVAAESKRLAAESEARRKSLEEALNQLFRSAADRVAKGSPEAVTDYGVARDVLIQERGPDEDLSINVTYNYANLLTQSQRVEEGQALLRDVLERRTRRLGPNHYDVLRVQADLARCRLQRGDLDEAERRLAECQRGFEQLQPSRPQAVALAQFYRGNIALAQNRLADAEALLLAAEKVMEPEPTLQKMHAAAVNLLANLFARLQEAEPSLEHAAKQRFWSERAQELRRRTEGAAP